MTPGGDIRAHHPLEQAVAAALVCGLIATLIVDVIGGLAGLLFGHGWVSVPLAEMPSVLLRLSESIARPRDAWPQGFRDGLPGPAGFAVALGLMLGVLATGVIYGLRLWERWGRAHDGSARWARHCDVRPLLLRRPHGRRVVLGRRGRYLVAAEPGESVLVVAPTQTGKTTGLAVPAILEWDGPVLATSVKSDLVRDSLAARSRVGQVHLFDPVATTGLPRAHWTPLAQCVDWESARRTADRLAKAAQPAPGLQHDAEFWAQTSVRFLAPLLLAAALTHRDMGEVARWIDAEDHEPVLDALDAPEHEAAKNAALSVWTAEDRLRSSLYLTASLALEAYNDPAVLECSKQAELTPGWLLDGRSNTAYVCAPSDEQARLRPLFATLVREIVAEVYARAATTGKPIERPLLLVLDEAANIAPLADLDQIASTGIGQGIQLVTVFQDLAQVHQRWGGKADTIVNNHSAKLFGPGIACARTLEYLARILGDVEVEQRSDTSNGEGRRSTTRSSTFRPLAPPNALRERGAGSMLLVYGRLPPAIVRMRPWYRDRALRALAGGSR